jgi:hypothetical protein
MMGRGMIGRGIMVGVRWKVNDCERNDRRGRMEGEQWRGEWWGGGGDWVGNVGEGNVGE